LYLKYKYFIIVLFLITRSLSAQNINEIEFRDQPIKDILLALAQVSGQSIIVDETVGGNATYYFTDMSLDAALNQFLGHYGIHYYQENHVYYVSKIKTEIEGEKISCQAENVDIQTLIKKLTRELGVTILHDALPNDDITINYQRGTLQELLEIIIKPYSLYYLEAGDRFFYIRKESTTSSGSSSSRSNRSPELFTQEGREYSANFEETRFREALKNLLQMKGVEYSFLGTNDSVIETFNHRGSSFEDILALLLEQGNASYQEVGGIYYIFDLDRQDILKRYYITEIISLENIDADDLSSLIPSNLSNSGAMKVNSEENSIILNGTLEEISPLETFIRDLDKPALGKSYKRYNLQFITNDELAERLSPELSGINYISVGERSFLATLSEKKHQALTSYLPLIDSIVPIYPIKLHYITYEELQELLPPNVDEDQIRKTQDPALIFFQGMEGEKKLFEEQLAIMDVPMPQLRYEVLVLQLEENQGLNLDTSITYSPDDDDSSTGFIGTLAGLASLNFDVVSQFGYLFSTSLSLELTDSVSDVLVDTTLHALSGEEISFQSTNTSRIATTTTDDDTGETEVTGYTEITSGLIIEITGEVSGDGMITMEVESTISSETSTSDDDDDDSSVPTTTEKVVTSHIRSQSGESIILSGLKQRETVVSINKVPILGSIPLLGYLFRNKTETLKSSELIITIVPYREEDLPQSADDVYSNIYERYCQRENL
jgi:general secretion pathway protein D